MKAVVVLLLLSPLAFSGFEGLAGTATNKVYKCVEGDNTVFSQLPCSKDAEQVDVKVIQGDPSIAENPDYSHKIEAVNQYIEQQGIGKQIARHERAIARYKQQLAADFKQLQNIRYRTTEDKSEAIKALSVKYDALIVKEQEAIKRLVKLRK
ncbi:MAG: hypothetical protein ACI8WB_005703 [Phenylobacterium sp.]|jgi:hypothetical protein